MRKKTMTIRSVFIDLKKNAALKKCVARWNKKHDDERPLNDFIREGVDLILEKYK